MSNQLPLLNDFDDIVFEHRNKVYGAYQLRKDSNNKLRNAFLVVIAVSALIAGGVFAYVAAQEYLQEKEIAMDFNQELKEAPPLDKNEPAPPPPPPPPPPKSEPPPPPPPVQEIETIQNVELKADKDIKKVELEINDKQNEAINIGTETKEGAKVDVSTLIKDIPEVTGNGNQIVEAPKEDDKVYTYAEEKAEFPGGEATMLKYLQSNIRYPQMAKESDIQGKCMIQFVVEKDGSITDVVIKKDIGGGCGKEAARVVSGMPRWKAAKANGKGVRYKVMLPVEFSLR